MRRGTLRHGLAGFVLLAVLAVSSVAGAAPARGYHGHARPEASGTQYLGARFYAAGPGRFLSPDPAPGNLENPQTLGRYGAMLANPATYTDPDGRAPSPSRLLLPARLLLRKVESLLPRASEDGAEAAAGKGITLNALVREIAGDRELARKPARFSKEKLERILGNLRPRVFIMKGNRWAYAQLYAHDARGLAGPIEGVGGREVPMLVLRRSPTQEEVIHELVHVGDILSGRWHRLTDDKREARAYGKVMELWSAGKIELTREQLKANILKLMEHGTP
jgi:RHS repeat-associated protein